MSNRTIKNMNMIVDKIKKVVDYNLNGSIEYVSTQEIKTMSNTYVTLLSEIKNLSKKELIELNIDESMYNHNEKLKDVVYNIEEHLIPNQLLKNNLRAVDNLATTNSKIKNIIRDIEYSAKKYESKLSMGKFKEDTFDKGILIDNNEKYNETYKLLESSIENGILIHQSNESLRGKGKTSACVKKASELNCLIITNSRIQTKIINKLASEMNEQVTSLPVTSIESIGQQQYADKAINGIIFDDISIKDDLNRIRGYKLKVLGGFTIL